MQCRACYVDYEVNPPTMLGYSMKSAGASFSEIAASLTDVSSGVDSPTFHDG